MNQVIVTLPVEKERTISADELEIGQTGEITNDDCMYKRHIILRHYSGFVSLTNPHKTWTNGVSSNFRVIPHPFGTTISFETQKGHS